MLHAFENSSNLIFHSCQFRGEDEERAQDSRENGLNALFTVTLFNAIHDSAARERILQSVPKTRHTEFINTLGSWVHQCQPDQPPLVLVTGPKSDLAQLCTESLESNLAATYFFSSLKYDDSSRFVTTIAYQLAIHSPTYAEALESVIRRNPALLTKCLKVQFSQLIIEPFRNLISQNAPNPERDPALSSDTFVMRPFQNLSNLVFYNCHFTDAPQHAAIQNDGLQQLIPVVLFDALHDSAVRETCPQDIPPTCHGDFVDDFASWSCGGSSTPSVALVDSPRSNLAQLCVERLEKHLAVTYFLSSPCYDDPANFFPTIAYPLAMHIPMYAEMLMHAVRRNPALSTKSLKVQFRELIFGPLSELRSPNTYLGQRSLVVIDGFDAYKQHVRREILRAVSEASREGLSLRWAFFGGGGKALAECGKGLIEENFCWRVNLDTHRHPRVYRMFSWRERILTTGWNLRRGGSRLALRRAGIAIWLGSLFTGGTFSCSNYVQRSEA
ncbi:hypothetical protein NP233_g6651 [Leucocoprinus birnbaumii]|uniref:Uncharacterized protein n=1 Tax=Leucocoprinus birnbaumii TaxID=56174 RepID=A0AAD5VTF9_9AGAR|nr:hypothetical protein NP233_g6651 [Leucocoprinus birnbaumii]